ncbi:hypothetical protein CU098_003748, partial [Rhizopus stolonifer]
IVTGSKDVIFGSFIDLEENNTMCNSYGLVFEYNMLVLPGCNTIQLSLVKSKSRITEKSTTMTDSSETRSRKAIQQAKVDALLGSIQKLKVRRNEFFLKNNIRYYKRNGSKKRKLSIDIETEYKQYQRLRT